MSGSAAISASPPAVLRRLEPELLAIEGGALEEVRELRPVARVVERELLLPRAGLDLRLEHHSSGELVRDRLFGLPCHEEAEGELLLLGEMREETGRAGEDRDGLDERSAA